MAEHVAFIGLGVMGYPMAGHLVRAGHKVTVFNRTNSKAEIWRKEFGGNLVPSPKEAANQADMVFACVGNDDDVRSITLGEDGAFSRMKPGAVFIDHTTASAGLARELAASADELGFGFLDAPVSGGQAGAENGALTVMVGGRSQDYERVAPVIGCYAKAMRLMGPAGCGQLTKMANQICIAGIVQGLAEALHFSEKAGLDGRAVVDVISQGAAQSWQMENRHKTMLDREFDFGFAVDWMRKDLKMCLEEAGVNGARLPLTALVDQFYADVQAKGGGRSDTSSLIVRFEENESSS